MASNFTDESFSDDSLEVVIKTPTTKGKKLVQRIKRKQTYLQLNQGRLSSDFLNLKSDNVKEESIHYPTRAGSNCEVTEVSGSSNADDLIGTTPKLLKSPKPSPKTSLKSHSKAPKEEPPQLWSEFLSRTQSEVEDKLKIFKMRVEYGKRMSNLNRFNQMCLSQSKNQKTIKATKPDVSSNSRNNLGKLSAKSFVKSEKIKESVTNTSMGKTTAAAGQDIQLKLEQMKIRHQKDKMIAEKIRKSTSPKRYDI